MDYVELLKAGFGNHVSVMLKRPGIMKLVAPLFHEDGDMIDIFLEDKSDGIVRISDHGLTLMRLSYNYDIDTPNKERILNQIITENKIYNDDSSLFLDVRAEDLYPSVLHFGQVVAKISSMSLYKRAVISDLFYEMVSEYVFSSLSSYRPKEGYKPIPEREELEVDYLFEFGRVPIYAFASKERESSKIRLIAISCLEFQRKSMPFRSVVIHQNFDSLGKKDMKIITSAADKQFISLEDFREHGTQTMERLAA